MTRRSAAKKLLASAALIGGALALTFGGAFATFTDAATGGPQTISSGTIEIGTSGSTLGTGATNIVPGDTISRLITLNSTGATASDATITLGFTANTSSLLDTDTTYGLQVSASSCSVAWTAGTPPTCTGTTTTVNLGGAASVAVATLKATPAALTPLNSLTPNHTDYLMLTLTLPATAPGNIATNPATCAGSGATENMEACTSTLTYTFTATQRAGAPQ